MPYYDLKCLKCKNTFKKLASMKQRENKEILCPECNNNELEPIFTNVNIIRSRKSNDCPNIHQCGGCCNH